MPYGAIADTTFRNKREMCRSSRPSHHKNPIVVTVISGCLLLCVVCRWGFAQVSSRRVHLEIFPQLRDRRSGFRLLAQMCQGEGFK